MKTGHRHRVLHLAAVAFALALAVACLDIAEPPSTDAGPDPEVSACCWKLVEGPSAVRECVGELTDDGECRWLQCLGGLLTFEVCR